MLGRILQLLAHSNVMSSVDGMMANREQRVLTLAGNQIVPFFIPVVLPLQRSILSIMATYTVLVLTPCSSSNHWIVCILVYRYSTMKLDIGLHIESYLAFLLSMWHSTTLVARVLVPVRDRGASFSYL